MVLQQIVMEHKVDLMRVCRLNYANVKFAVPFTVEKTVGRKTVAVDSGSACFSLAFTASLPPRSCSDISLGKMAGNRQGQDKNDTH